MPSTYKILGQIATTANTLSNVYSVPSATEAVVNSIVVTNTGASNASFSLLVRPDTDSDGDKNYIICNKDFFELSLYVKTHEV